MQFEWPGLLWGLLLIPLAVAAYIGLERRRSREAVSFANPALWPNLVRRSPGWRRHVPGILILLALAALLIALARPHTVIAVEREEGTVILAMDTSYSMRATDVPPDRLTAARAAAEVLIDSLPEQYRLGVVTFSGKAVVGTAPTTNRDVARAALDSVEARGGTAIGSAIEEALEAGGVRTEPRPALPPDGPQEDQPPLSILLISDGYSTEGTPPLQAATRAAAAEVPVFTIALGTQTGLGPDGRPAPPDRETLRRVAMLTGGQFFAAPTNDALRSVYADLGSEVSMVEERHEITVAAIAAALALFAAGGALSVAWFRRFP